MRKMATNFFRVPGRRGDRPVLAPILVDQVENIIRGLKEQRITILLVEQNANMALDVADYAYVMETGGIILEGPCSELRRDEKVIKAYLGGLE